MLEAALFDDGRTVTYLTLSREKCIPSADAKRWGCLHARAFSLGVLNRSAARLSRLLSEFCESHEESVAALYVVSGYLNGVFTTQVVDHASLAGTPALRCLNRRLLPRWQACATAVAWLPQA